LSLTHGASILHLPQLTTTDDGGAARTWPAPRQREERRDPFWQEQRVQHLLPLGTAAVPGVVVCYRGAATVPGSTAADVATAVTADEPAGPTRHATAVTSDEPATSGEPATADVFLAMVLASRKPDQQGAVSQAFLVLQWSVATLHTNGLGPSNLTCQCFIQWLLPAL